MSNSPRTAIVLGARKRVVGPIVDLTNAMDKLAAGDTSVQAPHRDREDEIGLMAAALTKFRENAINRVALEAAQRTQEQERAERSRRVGARFGLCRPAGRDAVHTPRIRAA